MLTIRLRSRDGLERIQLEAGATVGDLKTHIHKSLDVPTDQMTVSTDKRLLVSKDPSEFRDLSKNRASLRALGLQHGDLVYLWYPFERQVESVVRKSVFEGRGFGSKTTVEDMISRQTRIERQETAHCASVSFERHAANIFQQYVSSALAFSIKRGGLLYGTVDEVGNVKVDAIYEPPQSGNADSLQLERHTEEEQRADFLAEKLGLKKVGWIFTQSTKERDFIMSSEEISQMAAMQDELGQHCVTGVVSVAMSEGGSDVHFEAFQVSDQCVKLNREGWFQPQDEPAGVSTLRNPQEPEDKTPIIVAGKDVGELDNDYFLIPVKILDHEGPLQAAFPVENRLLAQGKTELRQHLQKSRSKPYVEQLSDFHLLLYLSKQPNFDLTSDIAHLAECVRSKSPVSEGYSIIIDSLADL